MEWNGMEWHSNSGLNKFLADFVCSKFQYSISNESILESPNASLKPNTSHVWLVEFDLRGSGFDRRSCFMPLSAWF